MGNRRVLVTGGAGFVGSHLCDRLLEQGHEIVALDNFYTGDRANVAHLGDRSGFSLVEHDVVAPFPELGGRFDWLFHLACPASPPRYQSDPIYTTRINFLGTLHALERAERDRARFFQASTSEVYGDPEVHPQREDYRGAVNTVGPRSCYDEGKRVAESLCMDFHRSRGVEVRIARIFNTYGPRMAANDGRVVSNFIVQALQNEDITIYGDGEQTRSFCYVSDLVDGFLLLMEHPEETGPVNLGNDAEFTIRQLADQVIAMTGSASKLKSLPLPVDDPTQRRPDLGRAIARLGFRHRVSLSDGLARTIEHFAGVVRSGRRENEA